eukprot:Em0004g97a
MSQAPPITRAAAVLFGPPAGRRKGRVRGERRPVVKVVLTLASRTRFKAIANYDQSLIEVFKKVSSKAYDAKACTWSFGIEDHDHLAKLIAKECPHMEISPVPKQLVSHFLASPTLRRIPVNWDQISSQLIVALMPFQKEGVEPSSSGYHGYLMRNINVVSSTKDSATRGLVNIISYDLLSRLAPEVQGKQFKAVIADECHFLKSTKTVRTKAALPILKAATRSVLLSGTPALSRPIELYTQISAVCKYLKMSFFEFGQRYCNGVKNRFGWDFSGASNMHELQLFLEDCVMIRRLKSEVMEQLPSKRRQMVLLDLGQDRKTAEWKEMKEELNKAAEQKGYKFVRIDGRTPSDVRQQYCDQFQHDEECQVAVLSITAANSGITLTAASTVVFAELFWNPGILVQAEDRVHRIGQKDAVNIHYLVASETADDFIWPLVQSKLEILSRAGLAKSDFLKTQSSCDMSDDSVTFSDADLTQLMEAEGTEAAGDGEHGHPAVATETSSQEVTTAAVANDVDTTKWFEEMSEEDLKQLDEF